MLFLLFLWLLFVLFYICTDGQPLQNKDLDLDLNIINYYPMKFPWFEAWSRGFLLVLLGHVIYIYDTGMKDFVNDINGVFPQFSYEAYLCVCIFFDKQPNVVHK